MVQLYCTLTTLLALTRDRVQNRNRDLLDRRNNDGLSTLELVVLGLGMFVMASALVAFVANYVNTQQQKIQ